MEREGDGERGRERHGERERETKRWREGQRGREEMGRRIGGVGVGGTRVAEQCWESNQLIKGIPIWPRTARLSFPTHRKRKRKQEGRKKRKKEKSSRVVLL